MAILVTGGAGYIGSHTCVELLNSGEKIIIVDNFLTSKPETLDKIKKITGKNFKFYKINLQDKKSLELVFKENKDIAEVIHFAGLKAVGESCQTPINYYQNNITGTLSLLEIMKKYNCKKIVFSSSATVYGVPKEVPIKEDFPLSPTNPYGNTKLMTEQILQDIYTSDNEWSIIALRYFNPIGAHESGIIGEDPKGKLTNLMPYINQVAIGELKYLKIFGNDYDTIDGTGIRDYIHVVDLSLGHLQALKKLRNIKGYKAYNLGTGKGYSVLEIIKTFEKVSNVKIKYEFRSRRQGDIAICYADATKAKKELNWTATRNLKRMCEDSWNFTKNNFNEKINKK